MKKTTKWAIALSTVLVAGGLTFAVPALATSSGGMMSSGMMSGGMMSGGMMSSGMMSDGMMSSGMMSGGMMSGGMMAMHNSMAPLMSQMPAMHDQAISEVAQLLGMTADELNTALADQSLADLAAEKGVAVEDIQAVMTAKMQAVVNQAVADGTLTQEQADLMLQHHEQNSGSCLSGAANGMMGGMMGDMMGGAYSMMSVPNPKN